MLFKNYFKILFSALTLLILSQTASSSVFEGKCGKDIVQVRIFNGLDLYERKYELYYKVKNKKYTLLYKTDSGVFFHIGCLRNKKKQDMLLFQEHCFGNGCPEAVYGIVDLSTKKILLNPIEWPEGNLKQVKQLLGYIPPTLDEDNGSSFCCSKRQYESLQE